MGLQNSFRLDECLGFPSRDFPAVHVAGTNGKGSVCTKIAKSLSLSGYKVGLYTSPHISSFRERIQITDLLIPEKTVAELLEHLFEICRKEQISATFFELVTALAFKYFSDQKVDIAVLETGLGGRLDATNIVTPLLSIITSISLDHTEILGASLEQISKEKAGIIKPKIPVIVGTNARNNIIKAVADQNDSSLLEVVSNTVFYDEENSAIALAALKKLKEKLTISEEAISKGILTRPPCRMECFLLSSTKKLILDVGHNPDGLEKLFHSLKNLYPKESFRLIAGLSKSKDIISCLKVLMDNACAIHLVEAKNGRGASKEILKKELLTLGFKKELIYCEETIEVTLDQAIKKNAGSAKETLVVCGSFFIMHDVRRYLGINVPADPIDMNERNRLLA